MNYRPLAAKERRALAALRSVGLSTAEIARQLGRHRSTGGRGLKRNAAPPDGWYRAVRAHQRAHARRGRPRKPAGRCWTLMARHPGRGATITADNGTECHWYQATGAVHPVKFYFAPPPHSWERGTNGHANGLLRQYLPQGRTMSKVTQSECDRIAGQLSSRPGKSHAFKTPSQGFLRH